MLLDLVKVSWKTLIFIALVSLTITWAFNIENTLITRETVNGIEIMHFNLATYMQNINNAWQSTTLAFETIIPPRTWEEITADFYEAEFWETIGNNLAYLFDWLYFPINFILWVDRWICWLFKIILAIIGWNTSINPNNGQYYSTLVKILVWIIDNFFIPYI